MGEGDVSPRAVRSNVGSPQMFNMASLGGPCELDALLQETDVLKRDGREVKAEEAHHHPQGSSGAVVGLGGSGRGLEDLGGSGRLRMQQEMSSTRRRSAGVEVLRNSTGGGGR